MENPDRHSDHDGEDHHCEDHHSDHEIPDSLPPENIIKPPHIISFSSCAGSTSQGGTPSEHVEPPPTKKRQRKPRQPVKAKAPKKPRQRKSKKEVRFDLLEPDLKQQSETEQVTSGPEMVRKIASVLCNTIGFTADKIFKGKGAILKQFQTNQLLIDLISKELLQYSPALGNKTQIAICSGANIWEGFQNQDQGGNPLQTPLVGDGQFGHVEEKKNKL